MSNDRAIIKLLPLLVIYLLLIVLVSDSQFKWDESGYVTYATNLVDGFSPGGRVFAISLNGQYTPGDHIIWWGPGYPLLLAPFVLLKLPWLAARLLNGFLLFGAVVYFYHTLRLYLPSRQSIVSAYIFGIYPLFLRWVPLLYTETLVVFLLTAAGFHFCRATRHEPGRFFHTTLAGFFLGYLALTKVFFGYVILAGMLIALPLSFLKGRPAFRLGAFACALAFALCTPWFVYTHALTGKHLYWGNSGGISLYWMSTPHENELGDWVGPESVATNPAIARNHLAFLEAVSRLPAVEQDAALKEAGIRNIRNHPKKFATNVLANIGRMVLHYPYSNTPQTLSTFAQMIPNMFVLAAGVVAAGLTWVGRRKIPTEILLLLGFNLIAFGGSSLLCAYPRQFMVLMPFFSLWIVVTISRTLKLDIARS